MFNQKKVKRLQEENSRRMSQLIERDIQISEQKNRIFELIEQLNKVGIFRNEKGQFQKL